MLIFMPTDHTDMRSFRNYCDDYDIPYTAAEGPTLLRREPNSSPSRYYHVLDPDRQTVGYVANVDAVQWYRDWNYARYLVALVTVPGLAVVAVPTY